MKKSELRKLIKEEIKSLNENKEFYPNMESHELDEIIKDAIDDLMVGDDLIIKINHSDSHGYDIEIENILL